MGQGRDLGSTRQRLFPGLSPSAYVYMYVCIYVPVYTVFMSVEAREQLWVLFLRLHPPCFFSETSSLTALELIK